MTVPDYSPAMLRFFLRARVRHAGALAAYVEPRNRLSGEKVERRLCKLAGVTRAEFDSAYAGRLMKAAPRARIWAAIDVFPVDRGVVLMDDGGQVPPADEIGGAG